MLSLYLDVKITFDYNLRMHLMLPGVFYKQTTTLRTLWYPTNGAWQTLSPKLPLAMFAQNQVVLKQRQHWYKIRDWVYLQPRIFVPRRVRFSMHSTQMSWNAKHVIRMTSWNILLNYLMLTNQLIHVYTGNTLLIVVTLGDSCHSCCCLVVYELACAT